jgi:hypothetical protein
VRRKWPRANRAAESLEELAPSHLPPRGFGLRGIVAVQFEPVKGRQDVRFESEGDICAATSNVRSTPNSDRKSGHRRTVMSALPLKADMCGANTDVG